MTDNIIAYHDSHSQIDRVVATVFVQGKLKNVQNLTFLITKIKIFQTYK